MKRNKIRIGMFISVLTLLFLVLPAVSAHIEVIDMGHYYDGMDRLGYLDYQNVADSNVSGAILVRIDTEIVAGEILDMPIRYRVGFQCSSIKTLVFPLNTSEGDHSIVVYVYSMNNSVERTYDYYAEDWWMKQGDKTENEPEEVDWLTCWGYD